MGAAKCHRGRGAKRKPIQQPIPPHPFGGFVASIPVTSGVQTRTEESSRKTAVNIQAAPDNYKAKTSEYRYFSDQSHVGEIKSPDRPACYCDTPESVQHTLNLHQIEPIELHADNSKAAKCQFPEEEDDEVSAMEVFSEEQDGTLFSKDFKNIFSRLRRHLKLLAAQSSKINSNDIEYLGPKVADMLLQNIAFASTNSECDTASSCQRLDKESIFVENFAQNHDAQIGNSYTNMHIVPWTGSDISLDHTLVNESKWICEEASNVKNRQYESKWICEEASNVKIRQSHTKEPPRNLLTWNHGASFPDTPIDQKEQMKSGSLALTSKDHEFLVLKSPDRRSSLGEDEMPSMKSRNELCQYPEVLDLCLWSPACNYATWNNDDKYGKTPDLSRDDYDTFDLCIPETAFTPVQQNGYYVISPRVGNMHEPSTFHNDEENWALTVYSGSGNETTSWMIESDSIVHGSHNYQKNLEFPWDSSSLSLCEPSNRILSGMVLKYDKDIDQLENISDDLNSAIVPGHGCGAFLQSTWTEDVVSNRWKNELESTYYSQASVSENLVSFSEECGTPPLEDNISYRPTGFEVFDGALSKWGLAGFNDFGEETS